MLFKTLAGFVLSLLLNTNLMLNLFLVFSLPKDVYFLFGYTLGFLAWAGMMTLFYCVNRTGLLISVFGVLIVFSSGLNAYMFIGGQ